jgi:hypothetical protein
MAQLHTALPGACQDPPPRFMPLLMRKGSRLWAALPCPAAGKALASPQRASYLLAAPTPSFACTSHSRKAGCTLALPPLFHGCPCRLPPLCHMRWTPFPAINARPASAPNAPISRPDPRAEPAPSAARTLPSLLLLYAPPVSPHTCSTHAHPLLQESGLHSPCTHAPSLPPLPLVNFSPPANAPKIYPLPLERPPPLTQPCRSLLCPAAGWMPGLPH